MQNTFKYIPGILTSPTRELGVYYSCTIYENESLHSIPVHGSFPQFKEVSEARKVRQDFLDDGEMHIGRLQTKF